MATESPQGGSPEQPDLTIVILGNAGEDRDKVVKSVLNCENLTPEEVLYTLYQSEQAGRKISVLEAPGWDKLRPDRIKEELVRSVSLCQPGLELIQQKTQAASGETEIRKRHGSLDSPPNVNKDQGDSEKKETTETAKPLEDMHKITIHFKQSVVILMGVFGALIGAVAGAENGVSGSCSGMVFGIIVGVLLASFIMYIYTRVYSQAYSKQPTQVHHKQLQS
ncbi:uncharacterized protein [Garra rufa]|uniref:uncharacterized protein n=1 Tax=Garra rufa TaxID=137080 RepID=UPI003CCECBCF